MHDHVPPLFFDLASHTPYIFNYRGVACARLESGTACLTDARRRVVGRPCQTKKNMDKYFTLSGLKLYADAVTDRTTTRVYGNGKMQVVVFPAAQPTMNTRPPVDVVNDIHKIREHVKQCLYDNVKIYNITSSGDKEEVTWKKSDTSNQYKHDIYHGQTLSDAKSGTRICQYDIRVPIYFTVPFGSTGEYRWIAEDARGAEPVPTNIVNVQCVSFIVNKSDLEFLTIAKYNKATLTALRYHGSGVPVYLKLFRCVEYKGIQFKATLKKNDQMAVNFFALPPGNCWITFAYSDCVGAFLSQESYPVSIACQDCHYDIQDIIVSGDFKPDFRNLTPTASNNDHWSSVQQFTSKQIETAWNAGIPMILLEKARFLEGTVFHTKDVKIEDNYGNIMSVDIIPKYDSEGWDDKPWLAVRKFEVVVPGW